MLIRQDWTKLDDTVDTVSRDHYGALDSRRQCRTMALWYMTGNEGDGSPHYPVPVIPDNHEWLANHLGKIAGDEWFDCWDWADGNRA